MNSKCQQTLDQIENKYAENENTTIHNLNDRLDFGLILKCAFSHFNFGLTKLRIVKMAYLSTFLCAIVLFALVVLWSIVEFFIESRKKEEASI
ncbi:hypothetical protein HXZ77_04830 [Acinetobacter johnsonii]|nr:hypothetical protein [Acinetobacter johnsonii]